MECVAETGGGRCARYARGSHAECERRATRAERRQSRPERSRQAEGKNPFQLDSKEPKWELFEDYLKGEVRFASVMKQYPNEAAELFQAAQENAQWRYKSYLRMLGTAW